MNSMNHKKIMKNLIILLFVGSSSLFAAEEPRKKFIPGSAFCVEHFASGRCFKLFFGGKGSNRLNPCPFHVHGQEAAVATYHDKGGKLLGLKHFEPEPNYVEPTTLLDPTIKETATKVKLHEGNYINTPTSLHFYNKDNECIYHDLLYNLVPDEACEKIGQSLATAEKYVDMDCLKRVALLKQLTNKNPGKY